MSEDAALFKRHQVGLQGVMGSAMAGAVAAATPAPPGKSTNAGDKGGERSLQAAAGRGVKPQDIETVLFTWDQVYRVSGLQYEETIYLLFKDGSAYKDLKLAPQDFDAEVARQSQPRQWVRWRKSGGQWQVRAADGGEWKSVKGWPAVAGGREQRLTGTFTHYAYGSSGAGLGGWSSTSSFHFKPDGRYERTGSSVMGTGVLQANNGTSVGAASSHSGQGSRSSVSVSGGADTIQGTGPAIAGGGTTTRNDGASFTGRYRIDSWQIELQRDDGNVERRLFLFTSAKRDAVNIGGVGYALPRK